MKAAAVSKAAKSSGPPYRRRLRGDRGVGSRFWLAWRTRSPLSDTHRRQAALPALTGRLNSQALNQKAESPPQIRPQTQTPPAEPTPKTGTGTATAGRRLLMAASRSYLECRCRNDRFARYLDCTRQKQVLTGRQNFFGMRQV
jgi:hypothetical protein